MAKANPDLSSPRSQLFTVRVWYEEGSAGDHQVRLQVKHVLTGETRYFRDWSALTAYLAGGRNEPEAQ